MSNLRVIVIVIVLAASAAIGSSLATVVTMDRMHCVYAR
jgi:hypothetical protein